MAPHESNHRGTIRWGPDPVSTDVANVGFRHPQDAVPGEIFASPDGLSSVDGVRIALVREADVGFPRCEKLDHRTMGDFIASGDIEQGDHICADTGAQYLAVYRIDGLPTASRTGYLVVGTSWARY